MRPLRFSFIVPFHRGLATLDRALGALAPVPPDSELIVAADGGDPCIDLAARHGARVVPLPRRSGPAAARNAAAAAARGEVLVFVDSDVAASREGLVRLRSAFSGAPAIDAIFGAYDERPADTGWMSQYKNLSHAFVHRRSAAEARTFWAGFGAVRRDAFAAVGGFDARFGRPSVEDIDLGYRLTRSGYRIVLDPELSCTHLKRWTLRSALLSDFCDRGVPWTRLLWRYGEFAADLNLRPEYRWSVALSWLLVLTLAGSVIRPSALGMVPPLLLATTLLNWRFYRYFYRLRGLVFTARVWLLRPVQDALNGVAFLAGTMLMLRERYIGGRTQPPQQADSRRKA